jgi:hypothetical protein
VYLEEEIKLMRNSGLWGEVREAVLQSVDCSQWNFQLTGMGGGGGGGVKCNEKNANRLAHTKKTKAQRTLFGSEWFREYWPPAITYHPSTDALARSHTPQFEPAWVKVQVEGSCAGRLVR